MSTQKYSLICVAHPDDETIFFAGVILRRRKHPWRIICLTDGNADGQGRKRRKQFEKATRLLGASATEWWGFPDIFEKRLDVDAISTRLKKLPKPQEIFTHGITGEYGHPHHQDVSFAVHTAFAEHKHVYSVAYNGYPDFILKLSKEEYELKAQILTEIYGSETNRFLNLLPATFTEGFFQLKMSEICALYDFFARGKPLRTKHLQRYAWLAANLKQNRTRSRPF